MDILENFVSWSLIPIFYIFFNVKLKRGKHFKICSVSLIFVIFLRFFFFDYHDFPITKMVCKCQFKYVKKIQNKNVHFIHLPFGKNL